MKKTKQFIETLPTANITPYDKNARKHPAKQIAVLVKAIQDFGFTNPLLIDQNNQLIAGHGRLQAAKQLGLKTVPCVRIEHLTEEQKQAYILVDNRIAELSTWNEDILAFEADWLAENNLDLGDYGFDPIALPDMEMDKTFDFSKADYGDQDIRKVHLMFSKEQGKIFLESAMALFGRYEVDNISDLMLALVLGSYQRAKGRLS